MTHLESLTKKLHALLPELRKPSKGCKVRWGQIVAELAGFSIARCEWLFLNEHGNIVPPELRLEDAEILGHPITLEHVMKALDEIRDPSRQKWLYINQTGRIWSDKHSKEIYIWKFGLPLHKQSPELHKFLDDLLPEQP